MSEKEKQLRRNVTKFFDHDESLKMKNLARGTIFFPENTIRKFKPEKNNNNYMMN